MNLISLDNKRTVWRLHETVVLFLRYNINEMEKFKCGMDMCHIHAYKTVYEPLFCVLKCTYLKNF
jgi:hypothetical protein